MRVNHNQQYKATVEKEVCQTLSERYKKMLGVKHKNSLKCHHYVLSGENGDQEEDVDEDGGNTESVDELALWNTQVMGV